MAFALQNGTLADDDGDEVYRPMAEINVTPMVDVMLVLLIIFMVAAPLMVQGVPLDLPRTSAAKLAKVRKPMVVSLAPDGALYIRDERVERGNLVNRLMALRHDEGDSVVYVRADRKIPYGDVMEILGRVGETGYQRVSLLSQPQPGAGASPGAAPSPAAGPTPTPTP
jgi:biopolymer transport protein TolR